MVFQAEPFYSDPAPRFRGVSDSLANHHVEASECCLIHVDNELSQTHGIWLNTNVRVSYNAKADEIVNPRSSAWPSKAEKVRGIWSNRWARWARFPSRYIERHHVDSSVRSWQAEPNLEELEKKFEERGSHCMINEMQVLVGNGWAHV